MHCAYRDTREGAPGRGAAIISQHRTRRAPSSNIPWTDAELADAVDAYVFLLRAQSVSLPFRSETAALALLDEGLPDRNDASLRYRFRNISAVVSELGAPILTGYSPAEQVGAKVRPRIRALLLRSPEFRIILARPQTLGTVPPIARPHDRHYALEVLKRLRQGLDDVEREVLGIGHNTPPEPLSSVGLRREAFDDVRQHIDALESEMEKPSPDQASVATNSEGLVHFGVKLATWAGQRTTKFVDAVLVALAPAIVLKLTGLLPILLEALETVARVFKH